MIEETLLMEAQGRINNICLMILAAVAVAFSLYVTRTVLIPFVFALFGYAVVAPVIRWLQVRGKMPRGVAILVTVGVFLLASGVLLGLVTTSLQDFFRSADEYRSRIQQFTVEVMSLTQTYGVAIDKELLNTEMGQIIGFARKFTGGFFSLIGDFGLVVIFMLFFIVGGETPAHTASPLLTEIRLQISRYVTAKSAVSLTTGVGVWIILAVFDVDLAFMFAVLTVLLNFIPNLGSSIAFALPLPVVLLQFGIGWQLATIMVLSGLVQFSIGNVVEPKLLGESMDLHPVTVLLFLMFWGLVWGLPGMFLAVPITAALKIAMGRIERTRPISELLAGRWVFNA